MSIINLLATEKYINYKCFDLLKHLLIHNKYFKLVVEQGYNKGKISGFDEIIWEKIRSQNIRTINNFEEVFIAGANIGYCTVASKQLSYSYNQCYLCGGTVEALKGTSNSIDGQHTWILHNGKVIDTTLMLVIDSEYLGLMGYDLQNMCNPLKDPIYQASKDFALDFSINENKKSK